MTAVTAVLRLLTFTLFVATSVQLPLPDGCSPVLVAFSPCLQYVSAPPNNMAETVPSQCCDAVNSAFNSGHGECLCEPLRQPLIFGFPLNETRLRSLSSVCHTSGSLESICSSGSSQTDLPPLHGGMTGPEIPNPPDSGSKQQFPFPSDSGEPQFPIPKPPDSSNLPHFPIPKPPDKKLPHFPIPKPSDNSLHCQFQNLITTQLPIPKPSDTILSCQFQNLLITTLNALPPLPFQKLLITTLNCLCLLSRFQKLLKPPSIAFASSPVSKPSDSGNDNTSAPTTSSPTTKLIRNRSRGSIATTKISKAIVGFYRD
ncbi:uncharacterized protein LOC116136545 [Pistacia vera]|uniref:uncharacterized protein LOC116136545 n=1 Tax=Pistacia vera TaxID=55513 RepID=UPI001262F7E7|nr:uncharacterized protein LOC116136545 [Pistacia vera]